MHFSWEEGAAPPTVLGGLLVRAQRNIGNNIHTNSPNYTFSVQEEKFPQVHKAKNRLHMIQQDKPRHPTPLQWLFLLGSAVAVNQTWIHRCDHGQFFTNARFEDEQSIPYSTVFAGIPDSYENLFFKSRYAFHYIYTHLSKDFERYMKADDDTYVIVEHLKEYLGRVNPDLPFYIGYRLRPQLEHGYNAGGAGYVLSRAALKIFSEQLYPNTTLCPDDKYEDVGIGRCLSNLGIYPLDTRNSKGQQRLNTFRPDEVFHESVRERSFWRYDPEIKGFDSVGADLISFHHLSPDKIRLFDKLLYRVDRPLTKKE